MAFSKYTVVEKFANAAKLDSRQIGIIRADGTSVILDANRNNVAVGQFINDSDPTDIRTFHMQGHDLSDAAIDAQARGIIDSLNKQEASLAEITVGVEVTPAAPKAEVAALSAAQVKFSKETLGAAIRERNDPAETAAYNELLAAQNAAERAKTSSDAAVVTP